MKLKCGSLGDVDTTGTAPRAARCGERGAPFNGVVARRAARQKRHRRGGVCCDRGNTSVLSFLPTCTPSSSAFATARRDFFLPRQLSDLLFFVRKPRNRWFCDSIFLIASSHPLPPFTFYCLPSSFITEPQRLSVMRVSQLDAEQVTILFLLCYSVVSMMSNNAIFSRYSSAVGHGITLDVGLPRSPNIQVF